MAGNRRARGRRFAGRALRYLLLTVLALVILFPLYMTLVNSLLTPQQIAAKPPTFFPTHPQWSSYSDAWSAGHMGRYLLNSAVVTTVITLGQVGTAILAGYAFAFLEFPLKRTLFVVFLATLMVPFEITIVTNLATINEPRLVQLVPGARGPVPRDRVRRVPDAPGVPAGAADLQDAASLDGYGHWRFMTRVAVPLARPAVAALSVFAFLGAWNQYLWPLLVTKDEKFRTVQIGLKQLRATSIDQVNVTFAGVIIAALPLVILLLLFQKQLVRGLTAGAVKG